ncbi:MAG: methionyl-tRNA formyltransferase [Syntrophales bacterium]|jgi:methionyl-tRNA formyltransferase|nr:methionyl-tRNA formyltransferase [Syntrophales bacterium]
MQAPSILFMGTPDFAVPSLKILIGNGAPLTGVVTQPDRPSGRGRRLTPPPVKVLAEASNLPLFQPERIRDESFLKIFRDLAPALVVVVAFGQILPMEMITRPRYGCINVHPSLLPKYRGAAPIQWSLIRGETMTGMTIMQMDEGVDSGDILLQEAVPIAPRDNFGSLHDRLAVLGAEMLLKTIGMIADGSIRPVKQDHSRATLAPRIKREDGLIDWSKGVREILSLIRGLSPNPGAYTFLDGKKLRVYAARGEASASGSSPGTVLRVGKDGNPAIAAADGLVYPEEIQMENRKRMSMADFLRGYRVTPETILGPLA